MAWTKRDVAAMFQQMVEARHVEMGRTVARLREAKGWNQLDLAHASGISVGTISRLENGKNEGRSNTVREIARALGVKAQDILPAADPDEGDLSQLDRIEAALAELEDKLDVLLKRTAQMPNVAVVAAEAAVKEVRRLAASDPPAAVPPGADSTQRSGAKRAARKAPARKNSEA
jgi:transcriptional regulator with XRE-family HTH domain